MFSNFYFSRANGPVCTRHTVDKGKIGKTVAVVKRKKTTSVRVSKWTYPEKSVSGYAVTTVNLMLCDGRPLREHLAHVHVQLCS